MESLGHVPQGGHVGWTNVRCVPSTHSAGAAAEKLRGASMQTWWIAETLK